MRTTDNLRKKSERDLINSINSTNDISKRKEYAKWSKELQSIGYVPILFGNSNQWENQLRRIPNGAITYVDCKIEGQPCSIGDFDKTKHYIADVLFPVMVKNNKIVVKGKVVKGDRKLKGENLTFKSWLGDVLSEQDSSQQNSSKLEEFNQFLAKFAKASMEWYRAFEQKAMKGDMEAKQGMADVKKVLARLNFSINKTKPVTSGAE